MDYPLGYNIENNNRTNHNINANYRPSYHHHGGVFNERSDISSMIFNNNPSDSHINTMDSIDNNNNNNDSNSSRLRPLMVMSTRPTTLHDPWHPHQQQQQQPSPFHTSNNNNEFPTNLQALQHPHESISRSERGIAGFVSKLYQCLQSPDTDQKYARWCQHDGKDMFIIDCIPEFTQVVLPRLFKHCKFPSFVRQLNIYGFQRNTDARKSKDTRDKESCRWYHPCFKPGRRDLFHLIRRKATRYSRKKRAKNDDPETILNVDSADEDEEEDEEAGEENIVLMINQHPTDLQQQEHTHSSASSVQHQQHIVVQQNLDYNHPTNSSASIQSLGFHQHHDLPVRSSPNVLSENNKHENTSNDNNNFNDHFDVNNILHMGDQELRLRICRMKNHYERMHAYYEEELSNAHMQIEEQRLRIKQLESALRTTTTVVKPAIKQEGYINSVTPFHHQFLASNNGQRRFIETPPAPSSSSASLSPKPNSHNHHHDHFYYSNENKNDTNTTTGNETNHNDLLPPPPPPASSTHWGSFRPTIDRSANGIVAAGSNTVENSQSPLIINRTLSNHMNYSSYL